jgi:hypothetical protein
LSGLSKQRREPKITKNHYYLNRDKALIRVISVNKKENRVVLYRYDTFLKEAIEYDTAPHYLVPMFKIGEVAKMLNRSVETIRKYEGQGLIPKANQFSISEAGKLSIRLYTEKEIYELAEFFSQRRSVGRPSNINKVSKINQKDLMTFLNSRFKQVK